MKKVEVVSDYTPLERPNKLNITIDSQGDIHISLWETPENKSNGERGVRIATSGGRHTHIVWKAFYDLVNAIENEKELFEKSLEELEEEKYNI